MVGTGDSNPRPLPCQVRRPTLKILSFQAKPIGDPLLAERIKRLRTVPGVGPITALTWALEMGEVSRFPSIRQAISYCGLCGDEKSSADKVTRTPPNSA